MSDYNQCPICHEWSWYSPHNCAPLWDWRSYYASSKADDWVLGEIHAHDAWGAAIKAAKAYDGDEYPLSRGGEVVIEVRPAGSEDVTRWSASAEMEPQYRVEPLEIEHEPPASFEDAVVRALRLRSL